jgi:integrase
MQLDLRAQGYGKERLELQPTPGNIKHAERMRQEILGKIERGNFSLADYFPDSPRAKGDAGSTTWQQLGAEWLALKRKEIEHSTAYHYAQTLGSYHFDDWNAKRVLALDYRQLKAKLGTLPDNPKTFNNVASVAKMVLEYGYKAKLLREPLHDHIEMRRLTKAKPDPFTLGEVETILGKLKDERGRNHYEFAFFSGLRPSEQIALQWRNVDLKAGTLLVDVARTRYKDKGTKTGEERTVELNTRARAALERQRKISQLSNAHVFPDVDGTAFNDTDGPLDAWWKAAIKLSGIRQRDARQSRHTYATLCLHAGLTPAWAAKQLGHSVEMFYRVYSKWIEGADKGVERNKMDAYLSGQTGT